MLAVPRDTRSSARSGKSFAAIAGTEARFHCVTLTSSTLSAIAALNRPYLGARAGSL
jgi:hypothetical protein